MSEKSNNIFFSTPGGYMGLLMIPGPVYLDERIIRAMSRQMIYHRGKKFSEVLKYCIEILKKLFGTKNDVYVISGSGTSGMEAAIASFSNVNKILCVENGKFGSRFVEIAKRYTQVEHVKFEWGESIDLEKIKESIEKGCDAIAFVHNETSTGILNPAEKICKIARKHDILVIMDAITSVGGDEVEMDKWGVDVAVVGSQKCIGAPPGLAAVAVSEKAWDFYNKKVPYYLDLKAYKDKLKTYQTPYTPALPLFFALEEALKIIENEGISNRIKRHRLFSLCVREWATHAGLELFPKISNFSAYSNTVTAIKVPKGISDYELRNTLKNKYGITISGGQAHLKGKIFRIGTMGNIKKYHLIATLIALENTLVKRGLIKSAMDVVLKLLE